MVAFAQKGKEQSLKRLLTQVKEGRVKVVFKLLTQVKEGRVKDI